jgi:hypothetical protein
LARYTPQWLQAGSYSAVADRRLIGALYPGPASSGCAVTASSGMTVNVAAGTIAVPSQNNTGSTLCTSDAVEPVSLAAAPGSGSNRYDLVVCQPRSNDLDGGANNDFVFAAVTGVAAASPTVPATPAGQVALAQIYVPGGSAAVSAGNIVDVRPGGLAAGGTGPGSPPRGHVASAVGPAAQTVYTAPATVVTLTVTLAAGRRYRVNGTCTGFQSTATGAQTNAYMLETAGLGPSWRIFQTTALGVNGWTGGAGAWIYAPTAATVTTFNLTGNASAGGLTVPANNAQIAVEDIGSQ